MSKKGKERVSIKKTAAAIRREKAAKKAAEAAEAANRHLAHQRVVQLLMAKGGFVEDAVALEECNRRLWPARQLATVETLEKEIFGEYPSGRIDEGLRDRLYTAAKLIRDYWDSQPKDITIEGKKIRKIWKKPIMFDITDSDYFHKYDVFGGNDGSLYMIMWMEVKSGFPVFKYSILKMTDYYDMYSIESSWGIHFLKIAERKFDAIAKRKVDCETVFYNLPADLVELENQFGRIISAACEKWGYRTVLLSIDPNLELD